MQSQGDKREEYRNKKGKEKQINELEKNGKKRSVLGSCKCI
jgi:hypothetical protein